jgi:hypothetical protein
VNYYETAKRVINDGNGMTFTYLQLKMMGYINPGIFSKPELLFALTTLVDEREVVQLILTIRGENTSLFFPKGTEICLTKSLSDSHIKLPL